MARSPCACGKSKIARVDPIEDVRFRTEQEFTSDDVTAWASCRMKCRVCGHVEKRVVAETVSLLRPQP